MRTCATADESTLLSNFLAGDPTARNELPRVLGSDVLRLAASIAPADLRRRGLVEDIVGRTWELLLRRRPGSFDPQRGTAVAYIATIVRTATRDVRAQNQYELRRSRDYIVGDRLELHGPQHTSGPVAVDAVYEVRDLLERAYGCDPAALDAARLIAFEDATLSAASTRVGLTRFALKRRLITTSDVRHLLAA